MGNRKKCNIWQLETSREYDTTRKEHFSRTQPQNLFSLSEFRIAVISKFKDVEENSGKIWITWEM